MMVGAVGLERMPGIDIDAVLRRVVEAGGPALTVVRSLGHGAVGAWVVAWPPSPGRRRSVLTWSPPLPAGAPPSGRIDRSVALVEVARAAGVPAPAYEAIIPLAGGDVVVLQEVAPGRPLRDGEVGGGVVGGLMELCERRRGVLRGHAAGREVTSLSLVRDGGGYCLHGPLAAYGARTRSLLERIEAIGAEPGGDDLCGEDLVHFDHHLGNVLVDERDPRRVSAIVDWGGARGGSVALDLVSLSFDLSRRPDAVAGGAYERVERHLLETTDPRLLRRLWAHVGLRMVDWSVRHTPAQVDHWLSVAPRHL